MDEAGKTANPNDEPVTEFPNIGDGDSLDRKLRQPKQPTAAAHLARGALMLALFTFPAIGLHNLKHPLAPRHEMVVDTAILGGILWVTSILLAAMAKGRYGRQEDQEGIGMAEAALYISTIGLTLVLVSLVIGVVRVNQSPPGCVTWDERTGPATLGACRMSSNSHWPAWKVLAVLCALFGSIGLALGLAGRWDGFVYLLIGMVVLAIGSIVLLIVIKVLGYFDGFVGDPDLDDDWFDFD